MLKVYQATLNIQIITTVTHMPTVYGYSKIQYKGDIPAN